MGPEYDCVTTRFLYRNNNSICLPCPELMCMYGCACVQAGATGRHIGAEGAMNIKEELTTQGPGP